MPPALAMQVSLATTGISRAAVLADHVRFGFRAASDAKAHLDQLLARLEETFPDAAQDLPDDLLALLEGRMRRQVRLLRE
jgi:hypothetical protein